MYLFYVGFNDTSDLRSKLVSLSTMTLNYKIKNLKEATHKINARLVEFRVAVIPIFCFAQDVVHSAFHKRL
ncbi:hypothetical protein L596_023068 [Steinernema carpocapsae]|uniref:Uncharacterized protein n=1 Tax=Steinernema carpocapsae TaxID=34508 RepID=A0A4U5MCS3_STECR|nr:hypothetical protein L596_023068 [Steinernema carpocapsae]